MTPGTPLVCPGCAATAPPEERFCPDCGLPLVFAGVAEGDQEVSDAHARARKVKKQYLDGELVMIASARHQAEAEMIQALLLDEGVPSMLRRTRGFDVPDMLAAGPRDILVPEGGAAVARELLTAAAVDSPRIARIPADGRTRILAICLLAAIVLPLLFFLVLVLTQ